MRGALALGCRLAGQLLASDLVPDSDPLLLHRVLVVWIVAALPAAACRRRRLIHRPYLATEALGGLLCRDRGHYALQVLQRTQPLVRGELLRRRAGGRYRSGGRRHRRRCPPTHPDLLLLIRRSHGNRVVGDPWRGDRLADLATHQSGDQLRGSDARDLGNSPQQRHGVVEHKLSGQGQHHCFGGRSL